MKRVDGHNDSHSSDNDSADNNTGIATKNSTLSSNKKSCYKDDDCVFCALMVPTCEPECDENSFCKIVPQTCCDCAYAYCKPKRRPVEPCIKCLWLPRCETMKCRSGTHCVEVPPTCHSCGSANCVPY
ncbi:hypothetical protein BDF22DRAFT_746222 [Syncephalis plumigaleata]|nr:hypothetical protein BDF22DRAFT_746222 [Syncephalis plumigaleata]